MRTEAQKRAEKKYAQSEKGKARDRKYFQSEKGKIALRKYRQSEKGKASDKKQWQNHKEKIMLRHKKYSKTEKGKTAIKKYEQSEKRKARQHTEKWKANNKKQTAKRKRNLGFIKINDNIFPKNVHVHWHHIDNEHVIALPRDVHRKCYAGQDIERHRVLCFQAIKCLYGTSVEDLQN